MANTAKNSKATKEQKEQVATSKANVNAIFDSVKEVTKSSGSIRSSIYKAELFDGLTDKQKKAIRRKLRRTRDSFIGLFFESQKDTAKLLALQEQWKTYATQVYNDINHIYETNTVEDNQDCCKRFVQAMAKDYTK